ncbi:MAG: UPF0175 family protein [Acidobacteriota bacterium]
MNISIELPDDIADQIGSRWNDLPRRALEALVADVYREQLISGSQVQTVLGLTPRFELDVFLKRAKVFLAYTDAELGADIRTLDARLGA